jgi:TRAP-type C4-dicarboxylate transport system substrate-binding protein
LIASEEQFGKLPQDIPDTLSAVALELEDWSLKEGERLDLELISKLRGRMQINQIDLIEFFHDAAVGIYRDYAATVPRGTELIARIEGLKRS